MTSAEAPAALGRYQRANPGARDRLRQVIEKAAGHPVGQLPMAELLLMARPRRNCPSLAVIVPDDDSHGPLTITNYPPRGRCGYSAQEQ
jgi:hypothetical protein